MLKNADNDEIKSIKFYQNDQFLNIKYNRFRFLLHYSPDEVFLDGKCIIASFKSILKFAVSKFTEEQPEKFK